MTLKKNRPVGYIISAINLHELSTLESFIRDNQSPQKCQPVTSDVTGWHTNEPNSNEPELVNLINERSSKRGYVDNLVEWSDLMAAGLTSKQAKQMLPFVRQHHITQERLQEIMLHSEDATRPVGYIISAIKNNFQYTRRNGTHRNRASFTEAGEEDIGLPF